MIARWTIVFVASLALGWGVCNCQTPADQSAEPVGQQLLPQDASDYSETPQRIIPKPTADDRTISRSDNPINWIRPAASLALVVVLIFLARWLLGRLGVVSRASAQGAGVVVLAHTAIPGKGHLILIRLGRRVVLVGNGSAGPNKICEISDPDELADILSPAQRVPKNTATGILSVEKPSADKTTGGGQ